MTVSILVGSLHLLVVLLLLVVSVQSLHTEVNRPPSSRFKETIPEFAKIHLAAMKVSVPLTSLCIVRQPEGRRL